MCFHIAFEVFVFEVCIFVFEVCVFKVQRFRNVFEVCAFEVCNVSKGVHKVFEVCVFEVCSVSELCVFMVRSKSVFSQCFRSVLFRSV